MRKLKLKTKLLTILSNLLTYFLIGIFFLGIVCVYVGFGGSSRGSRRTEFNPYTTLFGVVLLVPFLIYYLIIRTSEKKQEAQNKLLHKQLIDKAKKTVVDLKAVTVINKGTIKVENYGASNNDRFIEMNNLELIIPNKKGKKIRYPFRTRMDPKNVEIHLYLKGTTYLYTYKNSKRLDLDFLNEE